MAKKKDADALAALGPVCPMQMSNHIIASWCEYNQYDEICTGCKRNQGRIMSHYQIFKKGQGNGKGKN